MRTRESKIELLAPAGSWECLIAAMKAGADSIYFGVDKLNMRAKNGINFSIEDIQKITRICHRNKLKTYLALNTIMYDHDLRLAKQIIRRSKEAGVDAIIASDQAVIMMAREADLPVHISTQLNVTNIESVKFYSAFADLMVLARELTLEQVAMITAGIKKHRIQGPSGHPVKIEIFGHGALCMAVSGKCYLSLHSDFASANRGACVQNCRRKYEVRDAESGHEFLIDNEYIMSAKDLCTIGIVDRIVDAGVSVLKIEGRVRPEEYVYTVTKCYREAINAVSDGTFSAEKVADWEKRLSSVFNRGFWEGYYLGRKHGEWHDRDGSVATMKKVFIGRGNKYFSRAKVAEITIESQQLHVGDKILISGPTTGVVYSEVTELRKDDLQCQQAIKGDVVSIPLAEKIRAADKIYKIVNR